MAAANTGARVDLRINAAAVPAKQTDHSQRDKAISGKEFLFVAHKRHLHITNELMQIVSLHLHWLRQKLEKQLDIVKKCHNFSKPKREIL